MKNDSNGIGWYIVVHLQDYTGNECNITLLRYPSTIIPIEINIFIELNLNLQELLIKNIFHKKYNLEIRMLAFKVWMAERAYLHV